MPLPNFTSAAKTGKLPNFSKDKLPNFTPKKLQIDESKLSDYDAAEMKFGHIPNNQAGGGDQEFLTSVASNPIGFLKSLPGDALSLSSGISKLPYYAAADVVAKASDQLQGTLDANQKEYGQNMATLENNPDDKQPVDLFLSEVSQSNPALATVGKISKGIAETAPMMGIGALPAAVQKTIVTGFTADMLYHAPVAIAALVKEWSKPKAQQNPDVITDNLSEVIQDVVYGGLGAHGLRKTPGEISQALFQKYVPRGQGMNDELTGAALKMPAGAKPPTPEQTAQQMVPAVQLSPDKPPLTATGSETSHDDILRRAGMKPEDVPHEDPRRGFVNPQTGQWFTRSEAEAATGIKGTAAAGGLDSQDLPRADQPKPKAESPELDENLKLLREIMEDEHRAAAGRQISQQRQAAKTGKRPHLGGRPDGVPDVLDAIIEEGGIKPPGANAGGEYDGWAETMNKGAARLLRNQNSKHGPDTMIQALQHRGFEGIETADDLYKAVASASDERAGLVDKAAKEAKAVADQQKQFDRFTKSLNFHDNAVWSGNTKLADVTQNAKGENNFLPTEEGGALPAEYQEHVIEKYSFKDASREGAEAQSEIPEHEIVGNQKGKNLPDWAREEMINRGQDPKRALNDYDLTDPNVREAIQNDPTLSAEEKARVLATGSKEQMTPYGVPKAQWDEMANFNDHDQMKRYGTTRAKLSEKYLLGKYGRKEEASRQAVKAQSDSPRVAAFKMNIAEQEQKITEKQAVLKRLTEPTVIRDTQKLIEMYQRGLAKEKQWLANAQKEEGSGRVEGMGGRPRPRTFSETTRGRVEGMGSTPKSPTRMAAEESGKAMRQHSQDANPSTPTIPETRSLTEAVDAEDQTAAEAGSGKKIWLQGLREHFNPMSLSESAKDVATILRYVLGKQFANEQKFDASMKGFRSMFDRATTPRNFQYQKDAPLPPNWEVQRAIDSGAIDTLTSKEREFADIMRGMFDRAISQIHRFKPDILKDLYEDYFPRQWVKADGTPADQDALRLVRAHRPWEGPKTFLKARSLALWEDALKLGLKPRYDNPVDAVYAKLAEMWRFAGALEAHGMMKARGVRRFRYIFEKAPTGWTSAAPDDPSTKVFAPPTVTVHEAYDEMLRVKTYEMFKSLGISNDRLTKIGGKRWGWASESPEHVRTKFGGPDLVFWHEFGHIMDFRYPDLRKTLELKSNPLKDRELRALADARLAPGAGEKQRVNPKTGKTEKVRTGQGAYVRRAEEKMANVFHAYVHAPELFKQLAPNVWSAFNRWLENHPEVKGPLNDIRPSLRFGAATGEQFAGGPILLGEWMMPESAARVLQNYLDPSVWGRVRSLSAVKKLGGMMSNVRLISLFHGQMVSNDALASGLSLPLYDAMKALADQRPELLKRASSDFLLAPFRPMMALRQGNRILNTIRGKASGATELDKEIARYAVEANLRAGHVDHVDNATRRFKRALAEAANAWRGGDAKGTLAPAWSAFTQTPLMISHEMMRPVMEWFVPRMKYGLFAPMAMRVLRDNPEADEMKLRQLMGKAADSVEDRVGQVTYDNMFLSKAVRDSGQLALQAFGWHATKERMLWGAASDYTKAGKAMLKGQRPEITFRMAYLPAMVVTHALIGGAIMYGLSGRRPKHMIDYIFPETGLVDQYGKPVRLALADFMKDYLSEFDAVEHGPKAEAQLWERRLMPVWNELAEMWNNRDFWNTRIFSDRKFEEPEWQHLWDNLKEGVTYLGTGNLPFSARGAERFRQDLPANASEKQKIFANVGPYFGFVPAPMALTQTPAEARASEIMRDSLPAMSKDEEQRSLLLAELVHDLRTGKLDDEGQFISRARAAGVDPSTPSGKAKMTELRERVTWTPLQYQIFKLPLYQPGGGDAFSVWDLMSDTEKQATAPIFREKLQAAFKSKRLDPDETSRLLKVIMPFLMAKPVESPAQPGPPNVMSKY